MQEFLAGFVTETYQVKLREGFEEAKQLMEPAIDSAIDATLCAKTAAPLNWIHSLTALLSLRADP